MVIVRSPASVGLSAVLSLKNEAIAVAFRKHTLLPLDDCLYAPWASIPHLRDVEKFRQPLPTARPGRTTRVRRCRAAASY